MSSEPVAIYWLRRDLRLDDNHALHEALKGNIKVLFLFIFDVNILGKLQNKQDARVNFIYEMLLGLNAQLHKRGSAIKFYHSTPLHAFQDLIKEFNVKAVFTNKDYEPYARKRDDEISKFLFQNNVEFLQFKDQVNFHEREIVKDDGTPYTVFTPYFKKWLAKLNEQSIPSYPIKIREGALYSFNGKIPSLNSLGFEESAIKVEKPKIDSALIREYEKHRDYPSLPGTTRLGVHLRFGTISIRKLTETAASLNPVFLKELAWREFFMMILWHFPHVERHAFKSQYDKILWRNNENEFELWKEGKTGYPLVDAGMRELAETGFMHNRVRMLTASFLSKHLLIDWRWGEAWFAEKLLDYELASNNGNWQWAAGTGCDAAPYFRIFNPSEQTRKFDPERKYIRKWIPELDTADYPEPIVDHKEARERCLRVYRLVY